jgi:hypothetical protein
MSVRQGIQPADLDVKKLQRELLEKGAHLRIPKEEPLPQV